MDYKTTCTTKEQLTKTDTDFEDQLQFVSDAVMAFAYALRYLLILTQIIYLPCSATKIELIGLTLTDCPVKVGDKQGY